MGLCQSSEEDNQEHQRSNEIDKLLEKEKGSREKDCKILLLGIFVEKIQKENFLKIIYRKWRIWKINHIETDENNKFKWLF